MFLLMVHNISKHHLLHSVMLTETFQFYVIAASSPCLESCLGVSGHHLELQSSTPSLKKNRCHPALSQFNFLESQVQSCVSDFTASALVVTLIALISRSLRYIIFNWPSDEV